MRLDPDFCREQMGNCLSTCTKRPEGQSGENKTQSGYTPLTVVIKDGVQTSQPGIRVVETTSVVVQTDPVEIRTPGSSKKLLEGNNPADSISISDSDDDLTSLSPTDDPHTRNNLRLFQEPKNSDLDMDIFRKTERSEPNDKCRKGGSEPVKMTSTEGASNSDSDSTDSRDHNLNLIGVNSKNAFGNIKNLIMKNEFKSSGYRHSKDSDYGAELENVPTDNLQSRLQSNVEIEGTNKRNSQHDERNRITDSEQISSGEVVKSKPLHASTPNHSFEELDVLTNIPVEAKVNATYNISCDDLQINGDANNLTDEEIEKKFQDIVFQFRTDLNTVPTRLKLRQRQRNLAEDNVEREVESMKKALDSFQYSCTDSGLLQRIAEMKSQLDAILASTFHLSSTAESYGYVQNEEKVAGAVSIMLQHLENLERIKSENVKPDRLKTDSKRSHSTTPLDDERDDDRILRRRSVATDSMTSPSQRRASIASLPICNANRSVGASARKLSSSQASFSRVLANNSTVGSDQTFVRRESVLRYRKDNRTAESNMEHIDEFPDANQDSEGTGSGEEEQINSTSEENKLTMKRSRSIDESRSNSTSLETLNILDCMRRLVEWNMVLLSSARFRWPENVRHYVPFMLTWYVIILMALVFTSGLFTGINGCFTYSIVYPYPLIWSGYTTSGIVCVSLMSPLRPLRPIIMVLIGVCFFGWLILYLIQFLKAEDLEKILNQLEIYVQVRYPDGPPPT